MPFWFWMGPRNCVKCGSRSSWVREIFGKGAPIIKYSDFLPWAVQKWLNLSICHLGCGLEWAKECTSSFVFTSWCQCALMGGHIDTTWRLWLNCPCAAAMRPYVKLLLPLGIIIICLFCALHLDSGIRNPRLKESLGGWRKDEVLWAIPLLGTRRPSSCTKILHQLFLRI